MRRFSLNFVKELKPRPITRDLDWGVPIPVAGYEELSEKRIYVWFDAVIGYLSASIEWASNRGTPDAWREWWQSPDAEHTYFMGKDNIVFHTVIWPSMLLGYGEGGEYGAGRAPLELPDNVASSEFLTMEGKKFSSSRGVQILVRDFLSRYDPDSLRYFLSIAGPETQDTDFTWSEFVRRNNDELVATWGNLVNRTLQSAYKNFGVVPTPGTLTDADGTLLAEVEGGFDTVGSLIEAARFKNALQETMRLAGLVNQYIAEQAPWSLIESDRERAGTILYVALRAIDNLKVLLTPYLPFSSQRLHELLGYEGLLAGPIEQRVVTEESGEEHTVLTGEYETWIGAWEPSALTPGQALREPAAPVREARPRHDRAGGAPADGDGRGGGAPGRRRGSRRVTDTHAHLDGCEDAERRSRMPELRGSGGSSPSARGSTRRVPRSTSPTVTKASTPCSGSTRIRHRRRRRLGSASFVSCSRTPNVVGVGETGLDNVREHATRRRSAASLRGAARACRGAEPSRRHPQPRGGGGHGRRARRLRGDGRTALLLVAGTPPVRARAGLLRVVRRQRDVPEGGRPPRGRTRRAATTESSSRPTVPI